MNTATICAGFGTRDACGKCEITLSKENRDLLSLAQLATLLCNMTYIFQGGDSEIIYIEHCKIECKSMFPSWPYAKPTNLNRPHQLVDSEVDYWRYGKLIALALLDWRTPASQEEINEMTYGRKRELFLCYHFSKKFHEDSNFSQLWRSIRNMCKCVRDSMELDQYDVTFKEVHDRQKLLAYYLQQA